MAIKFLSGISLETNELQHVALHPLSSAPSSPSPVEGQIYYITGDDLLYTYDGSSWNAVAAGGSGDITGVTAGVGLSGGGSSGGVTLTLDLSELSTVTPADGDFFATLDSDGANEQKTTTTALASLFAGTGIDASSSVLSTSASQTGISSVLNTSLVVGRDGHNQIDFGTDNQIKFKTNNETPVIIMKASGEIEATSLDISGDVDVDGTLETDAFSIGGTTVSSTAAELNILDGVTSTAAEINLIDGDTARGTTSVANGDGFLHNDAGTMRMTNVSKLADLFAGTGLSASSSAIAVDAEQTGITSIHATDLIIGEDAQTAIDFGTANEIDFKADNAARLTLTASALYPVTDDQIDLGTASLEFKDAFFDGTVTSDAFAGPLTGNVTGDVTGTASLATVTDSTANTNFPVVFNNESDALLDDTGALYYNPSTGLLTVPNLSVAGTTTQVNTVTMNAQNAVVFEGATADGYETTLSVVDPTADHTQYLTNDTGYIPLLAAATTTTITSTPAELNILDGVTSTAAELNILDGVTSTTAEINLIDGGTARGTTAVASGDGILINDGGTMRMTNVDTVSTYFASHTVGGGNIVTTGALNSGSITSGFGNINTDLIYNIPK